VTRSEHSLGLVPIAVRRQSGFFTTSYRLGPRRVLQTHGRLPTWITHVLGADRFRRWRLAAVRKRIGRSDIIGEQGIAHIRRMVLDMGYVFYETGGIEAGIDGYIELRDQTTGEVGNLILQVQGKATERDRLPAETPDSFEWPCTEADIAYGCTARRLCC
jgi:hypothetical protein